MGVVVVIDPGHGGENLGGNIDEFVEKELTLKVAGYMKERLSQYEGVEVYLTHDNTEDPDLTREERANIAKSYNADFLYSLHFNMSEEHTLYGCEVWTSAFGEYYKKGQEFASIEMEGLTGGPGFFDRGVKTRLGKDGDDYYGIILHAKKQDIPCVIIEHCHMDESRDNEYLRNNGEEAYKTLGYIDADSVAKYFHLKSDTLGVDYSGYSYSEVAIPASAVGPDLTEPEYCNIELIDADTESGIAHVKVSAADSDSMVQYVSLSYDGGNTFDKLYPWNDDKTANKATDNESITVEVALKPGMDTSLVARAYNRYDRITESGILTLPAMEVEEESEDAENMIGTDDGQTGIGASNGENVYGEGSDSVIDVSGYTEVDATVNKGTDKGNYTAIYILFGLILVAAMVTIGMGAYITQIKRRNRHLKKNGKKRKRR